jgi:RNA polymerase sigma-70 factor (ECF subfamily)
LKKLVERLNKESKNLSKERNYILKLNVINNRELKKEEIESLVEQAKNLNREALSKLCIYFYPKIYRHVFYRVKNRDDAEDITSEVFVRMVKFLNRQKGSFQAWLYRIASNLVVDYYRRSARKKEVSLSEDFGEELGDRKDISEGILLHQHLSKALGELTEEQQQVVTLKFLEGYDNSEVSEILGRSIGAVKALQFRALDRLRKVLNKED